MTLDILPHCAFLGICVPRPEIIVHAVQKEPICFLVHSKVHPKEYNLFVLSDVLSDIEKSL